MSTRNSGGDADGDGIETAGESVAAAVEGPLEASWTVESLPDAPEVTLVRVELRNPTAVDRRVRVTNRLGGPVLPPRREGVPERGWTERGYDGTVDAGGRLALGYATPAAVERPPVAVVDDGRADGSGRSESTPEPGTRPEAVVRQLGSPRPPADALPDPSSPEGGDVREPDEGAAGRLRETAVETSSLPTGSAGSADVESAEGSVRESLRSDPTPTDADAPSTAGSDSSDSDGTPESVQRWFAGVERRVERGERLTDASVAEATAVLAAAGGLAAVEGLPNRLAADVEALRRFADRAERLADRAEGTDVPAEALRRLA